MASYQLIQRLISCLCTFSQGLMMVMVLLTLRVISSVLCMRSPQWMNTFAHGWWTGLCSAGEVIVMVSSVMAAPWIQLYRYWFGDDERNQKFVLRQDSVLMFPILAILSV